MGGRHAAIESARQDRVNALARGCVVAVARHEHEHRDETVEAIEAQEDAHLGPVAQRQDAERSREQFVLADLEQLVARERVEDVGQRLAVMAVGGQPCARQHVADFASEQRDFRGQAVVGA